MLPIYFNALEPMTVLGLSVNENLLNRRRREGRWMESAEVESSESCFSIPPKIQSFHLSVFNTLYAI